MNDDFQELVRDWKTTSLSLSDYKEKVMKEEKKMKRSIIIEIAAGLAVVAFYTQRLVTDPGPKVIALAVITAIFLGFYYLGLLKMLKGTWQPYAESVSAFRDLTAARLTRKIQWSRYLTKIGLGFGFAATAVYVWVFNDGLAKFPETNWVKASTPLLISFILFWSISLGTLAYVRRQANKAQSELDNLKAI